MMTVPVAVWLSCVLASDWSPRLSVEPEPARPIKSAVRALELLELVAQREGVTVVQVARELGLPKSSAHGLLFSLASEGWLRRDSSGVFWLAGRAWLLGRSSAFSGVFSTGVDAVLESIVAATSETAQFSVLEDDECVYLAVRESPQPMSLFSRVGARLHVHATAAGKAMLSVLDEAERKSVVSRLSFDALTPATLTSPEELEPVLRKAVEDGFATEVEEYVPNSTCVAVPVDLREQAGILGALTVTTPSHRRGRDWPQALIPVLLEGAARLRGLARSDRT